MYIKTKKQSLKKNSQYREAMSQNSTIPEDRHPTSGSK